MLTNHDSDLEPTASRLGLGQRLLLVLPRMQRDREKRDFGERFRNAVLKPVDPETAAEQKGKQKALPVEELRVLARSANDKERLVGLLGAPFAAAIGILVISDLITHDPAPKLASGLPNPHYVSLSLYHDLTIVLLGLSVLMLATAWFRKRLYLGMAMALYGLAIFNLHYWGFGIPFIMCAAWLLVRAYRYQRDLRDATGEGPARWSGANTASTPRAMASKRYTPPTPATRR